MGKRNTVGMTQWQLTKNNMQTRSQILIAKRPWQKWARESLGPSSVPEPKLDELLFGWAKSKREIYAEALSFEVSGISLESGIKLVCDAFNLPDFDLLVVTVGAGGQSLLLRKEQLPILLQRLAETEAVAAIRPTSGAGSCVLDFTKEEGGTYDLQLSGNGVFEGIVAECKTAFPDGALFRGN
jgi:hypothetical protein